MREIPADELPRFLLNRSGTTWDALSSGTPLDAIDPHKVKRFIREAGSRLPRADAAEEVGELLARLDLLVEGAPTRGAVLLFGKNPQALCFAAHVRMGRFKDDITIVDEGAIKGTLFDQLDGVMQRFR